MTMGAEGRRSSGPPIFHSSLLPTLGQSLHFPFRQSYYREPHKWCSGYG
jgi:hypothetical protein